jgi:hypothetical protein
MDKETFEKEKVQCRELSQKNGGRCNWGECAKCGVIPFMYKLAEGRFYEKEDEIRELKRKVLE